MTLTAQPTINISSATANNGETVDINVTVDDYTDYISLEFYLIWDQNVVRYQSISNVTNGLPGFTQLSSINASQGDPSQSDTIYVSWFESNLTPTTLPDGTNLFTITFEVVGDPCDVTALTIPNVEIVDENEEIAATIVNPGSINVPGIDCGTFNGVRIIGEQKTVGSGSPVCIKFTCEGFDNVIAGQYTITFNPSVITYTGIQNINWPDLVQGTTFSDAEAASGILRVVWTDPNVVGVDLADGTVLYELCFTAVGSGGQMSQIGFGNNPVMIEFADSNSEPLAFQGVPGKVTIEGVIDGFALLLPDIEAQQGEEVCLPITVNDFIDIIVVQTSINWDSTVLEFVRFEGFNLPELAESVAGPEGAANNASEAVIAWNDPMLTTGITLQDGAEILRICFNVIGVCDESSVVSFSHTPSIIEFADINEEITAYTLVDGTVTINCAPCGANIVSVLDICAGGEVGGIDISVTGGCEEPVTYLWWPNGATTQVLTGVPAGKYVVTITVGGNTFIVLDTITIRLLQPIQVTASINNAPNGMINITVSGGEPGYTFEWSNDEQTEDISNLAPGQYTVTITDANGCTFVAGPFEVDDNTAIIADVQHVDCFGACTGSINITAVNCVPPPHTYLWTGPSGTPPPVPMLSNLCPGLYSVTVTGMGGNTCTASFEILQASSAISVVIDTTNETSVGNNGVIDLTVSGGQAPYTYVWSDGPLTQDRSGLSAGNYTVTITDQFGCDVIRTILIQGIALIVNITGSSYNGSGVSCAQKCDGEVLALPVNGVGNMTYLWSNGRTSQVISDLCAGTYCVTVTDGLGRSSIVCYTLVEPDALILQLEIKCASEPGIPDGSAFAQVSGGTQPYQYNWSNGTTNASMQNVAFGQYLLIVTDDNGCQIMQPFDICISGATCYQAITVITPNGDDKNDRFTIKCIHDLPNVLSIYNRYGGLEFEMQNYNNSWEGTDQEGNILSDGGYHWVLQVFYPNGDTKLYKGTVSLVLSLD